MRRRLEEIPDDLSPDFSVCEHCGERIGWDDYSYTHMSNGFATCGTTVGSASKRILKGWGVKTPGVQVMINPEITQDPNFTTSAEPVEWYEGVAG